VGVWLTPAFSGGGTRGVTPVKKAHRKTGGPLIVEIGGPVRLRF